MRRRKRRRRKGRGRGGGKGKTVAYISHHARPEDYNPQHAPRDSAVTGGASQGHRARPRASPEHAPATRSQHSRAPAQVEFIRSTTRAQLPLPAPQNWVFAPRFLLKYRQSHSKAPRGPRELRVHPQKEQQDTPEHEGFQVCLPHSVYLQELQKFHI